MPYNTPLSIIKAANRTKLQYETTVVFIFLGYAAAATDSNNTAVLLKPRLHRGNMCPATCCPDEQLVPRVHTCWRTHVSRQQVARSVYMLTVSRRHNYYSFMSRSTCILLYPATDGQQTGNNFVADTRHMLTETCCRATCFPGVNEA